MQVDRNILETEERHLRLDRHLKQMTEDRLRKKILNWKIKGKRKGKFGECWMD